MQWFDEDKDEWINKDVCHKKYFNVHSTGQERESRAMNISATLNYLVFKVFIFLSHDENELTLHLEEEEKDEGKDLSRMKSFKNYFL